MSGQIFQGNHLIAETNDAPLGFEQGGIEVTQAQYDQLVEDGNVAEDTNYYITDTKVIMRNNEKYNSDVITCTVQQYEAWKEAGLLNPKSYYLVSGEPGLEDLIDDDNVSYVTTYSSEKIEDIVSDAEEVAVQASCKNTIKNNSVRMIAHRGYSSVAPENSDLAFRMAGDAGFYGAECDVQKSSDGTFVIMHDTSLTRTTSGTGTVASHTLSELRGYIIGGGSDTSVRDKLVSHLNNYGGLVYSTSQNAWVSAGTARTDLRQWIQGVPTLEEYLNICKRFNIVPVIELKTDLSVEDIPAFNAILNKWSFEGKQCVVISFGLTMLEKLRELNKSIMIQPLVDLTIANIDYCAEKFGPNCGIDAPYAQATQELIDYAHQKGVEVNLWTCDDNNTCQRLAMMGADYITTNSVVNPYENTTSKPKIKTFRQDVESTLEQLSAAANRNKRRKIKPDVRFGAHEVGCSAPGYPAVQKQLSVTYGYYNNAYRKYYSYEYEAFTPDFMKMRAIDKNIYYTTAKKLKVESTVFNTYNITVVGFTSDGNLVCDQGWLNPGSPTYTSLICSLPKDCVYFYLYFKRSDNATLTDADITAINNGFVITEIGDDNSIIRATTENVALCNYTSITPSATTSDEPNKTYSATHTYDTTAAQSLSVGPFYTNGSGSVITVSYPASTFTSAQILEYDRFMILRGKATLTSGATYTCTCDDGFVDFQFATGSSTITPAQILELQNNFIATMGD